MTQKNTEMNRVQVPVDIAAKMFADQRDSILRTIQGPAPRKPQEPLPVDSFSLAEFLGEPAPMEPPALPPNPLDEALQMLDQMGGGAI